MYAPKKWFDKFPRDQIKLPEVREDDLDDLSEYAISLTRDEHVAPLHQWVRESGQWPHAVQAYLATTAFADDCLGRVLAALDASPHAKNTIVVAWTDHGFHLGEKDRWAKRSLWEDSTRVPLIIVTPGGKAGQRCAMPVELIDLYPTLMELCGIDAPPGLEGQSLVPLLDDPVTDWPHLARTSFGPRNVALRGPRYRYIRYADGSEELYDHETDPHEWTNLAAEPAQAERLATFRGRLPTTYHEALGKRSTGHKTYEAASKYIKP
jgi:arylsulfatase A-like enzyme